MPAHVVEGARGDFRKTREARKVQKVMKLPEFSQFLGDSLESFWHFLEWIFNDSTPP